MMTACQGTFPSMVTGLQQDASVRKMAKKSKSHDTRQTLLEKLRQKMGINNRTEAGSSENFEPKCRRHMRNNKMAEKKTRKIEIGWFHEGKQVRKRSGGGTYGGREVQNKTTNRKTNNKYKSKI